MTLKMSFILLLVKVLTTSLTVGTGNSGGIFMPSLFMGAMLGQCYGMITNLVFPKFTAPASAYALVGMAAFFSGAVRAPITAILIIFEMTGNYNLVLPLMLTTVSSSLFSKWLSEDTIYTKKLTRRGIAPKNKHNRHSQN
jgi:CIC family chloride channel protein